MLYGVSPSKDIVQIQYPVVLVPFILQGVGRWDSNILAVVSRMCNSISGHWDLRDIG